ncbi:hypothetical protein SAMN04487897_11714 [Paenibacillus sp. yr247]|uniref:hypothetical protein n=1 Tax=Paenibacillus sp. yr247 TaxID=1761880 RepID=UPI00087FC9FA|nr:hypothetical protein [Paenibacillus sp. yr247]SDO57196.1 hypothetical protein SAMN04487897_11714 [Paenibacillus sp. yr247]
MKTFIEQELLAAAKEVSATSENTITMKQLFEYRKNERKKRRQDIYRNVSSYRQEVNNILNGKEPQD